MQRSKEFSRLRREGSRGRRAAVVVSVLGLSALGVLLAVDLPQPGGSPNDPQFEVEGDKKADGAGKLDWDTGAAGTGVIQLTRNSDGTCTQTNTFEVGTPGVAGGGAGVCDGSAGNFSDLNTFVQGSKEEDNGGTTTVSNWVIKAQGNPKKGDLAEVYVYGKVGDSAFDADTKADDLFIFVDMTRLDVNGDTHADFELNQKAQTGCGDSDPTTFCQERSAGDVIVSFDLAQGGASPTVRVYEYKTTLGAGEACANSPQTAVPPGCYVQLTAPPTGPGGEPAQFGVLNAVEIDAPSWGTVGCEKTSDNPASGCTLRSRIPARADMEGFVDLTAFLGDNFSLCPGFGQVTVKTRSSDGLNAALKDTTAPIPVNLAICGSVLVKKFQGDGATLLPGAGFTFSPNPFTVGDPPLEVKDGDTNDHADGNDGCVCLDRVLFNTYTVTETTVPPGFIGDPGSRTVNVTEPSVCAERLASGCAAATADVSFTNKQGSLIIRKEAKDARVGGNSLLGGARFRVVPNPATGTGFLDVTDGDASDVFGAPGVICLEKALPGTYSVQELESFTTYLEDPTIRSAVASNKSCADRSASESDVTFVNTPLSQIDVIFTSLAGAGITKATITCGAQSSTSGSLTLTGLVPGTYNCTVLIDP